MFSFSGDKSIFGCSTAVIGGVSVERNIKGDQFVKTALTNKIKYTFYVMCDAQPKDPKDTTMIRAKKYIEDEKLGPIIESEGWHYNEAHGPRYIKIYIWRPDYEMGEKWLKTHEDVKSSRDSMW